MRSVVVVVVYFILSRLLYLADSANLGPLCMSHPGMGPLVYRPFRRTDAVDYDFCLTLKFPLSSEALTDGLVSPLTNVFMACQSDIAIFQHIVGYCF